MEGQHIGTEIGMLGNLLRRQMSCPADCGDGHLTGMQSRIIHHLILEEVKGDSFQRDIETFFRIRRSTATGLLQLMERNGLLRREPVTHDARLKRLVLTEKARALDESIGRRIEQTESVMKRGIDQEKLEIWFGVCKQIRANLEQSQNHRQEGRV